MGFNRIVAVDNIGFTEDKYAELEEFTKELKIYRDYPTDSEEISRRIGNADCVLVSWNTRIDRSVIERCENIKYIGMCCSLYDEKSANVDIAAARERNITVLGVRDYGDQGVVEFVITELIDLLHGFGEHQWRKDQVLEITGIKIGIIGLGKTGSMVAAALKMFGGDVCYYDMVRNPELEEKGIRYLELDGLLRTVDILCTHLPKHLRIMDKEKLEIFGSGKIYINPSIGPTYQIDDMVSWLSDRTNYLISEKSSMGECLERFRQFENFIYTPKVCGMTEQARQRLIEKVLNNIRSYLAADK